MDSISSASDLNRLASQSLLPESPLNTNLPNQRSVSRLGSSGNSAPVLLNTAVSLAPVNEDAAAPTNTTAGTLVSSIVSATNVSDADSLALKGIAITAYNADPTTTKGNLWYTTDNGTKWERVLSSITEDKALLLEANQSTRIYFQPTLNYFGTIDDAFTFRAWDMTEGSNGNKDVNTSINGEATAFSAATDVVSLQVNGVNDAPVNSVPSTIVLNPIRINEDGEIVFSGNNLISVSDVDAGTNSIKVTLQTTTGTLTLNNAANAGVTATGSRSNNLSLIGSQSSINAAIRGLKFNLAPDESGDAEITIVSNDQVTPAAGETTDKIYIAVNSVNDTPSFVGGSDQVVTEDMSQQPVTWASKISKGAANELEQALEFIVTTNKDELFDGPITIAPDTGILTYKLAKDANGSATVTVKLKDDGDGANTSPEQTFTITINENNDAPVNTVPTTTLTIDEDKQLVFSNRNLISITDIDAGTDIMKVTLTADNGRLKLASTTGLGSISGDNSRSLIITGTETSINTALKDLMFTPTTNFNGATKITVLTNDQSTRGGGRGETLSTINLQINPVNDAPTFNMGSTLTVNEDAPAQTVRGWATNISKGAADESSQTLEFIVDADKKDLFAVDGQPTITPEGNLTYKVTPNANGTATVTVKLKDNSTATNTSAEKNFTINVTPTNDRPVNTVPSAQTIDEDSSLIFSAENKNLISINDIDAGNSEVEVTLKTRNGNITLGNQSKVSTVTNDGTPSVTLKGTVENINTDLEGLIFKPIENFNGSTTIQVITNDKGNTGSGIGVIELTDTDSISIQVNSVNDAPTFVKGVDLTAQEDEQTRVISGWATQISAGANNESNQVLTFAVTNDHPELFAIQPTIDAKTGTLTFKAAENISDRTVVTVIAELKDNGGTTNSGDKDTSEPQTFTITLNPTNDAPVNSVPTTVQPLKEDDTLTFSKANNNLISVSDADINTSGTVEVTITAANGTLAVSNKTILTPNGDGTGNLTLSGFIDDINTALDGLKFTPTANFNGLTKITIVTTEQGVTATVTNDINVNISAVNDAPTLTPGTNITTIAGAGKQTLNTWAKFSPGPKDESTQTIVDKYIISNSNPQLFQVAPEIDSAGNLTFTPAATVDKVTTATIGLKVKDSGGIVDGGVDTSVEEKTFTITINPLLVNITTATASVNEANSDTTTEYNFTVSLSSPSTETVTVKYTAADDTATTSDQDYIADSGTISFAPGQISKTVKVLVKGDIKYEADQTFKVNLSDPSQAVLGTATAVGTIKNDDSQPVISIADASKKEGNSTTKPFAFNVSLSNASDEEVTVNYTVANGTAIAREDYATPGNGVLKFAPGQTSQTIAIDVTGDTSIEVNETFQVNLSNPSSSATIATNGGMAVGTIINDDGTNDIDFNGDGNQDLVWRNYRSGENAIWQMNGTMISEAVFTTKQEDINWKIEAVADFTGDGKSDLLWRNYSTGENEIWQMNGGVRENVFKLITITDKDWKIEATADFNGDRMMDIVWRNYGTGENAIWQMNGTTLDKGTFLTKVDDSAWTIEQVGDFNGDRTPDLLWRNYRTGENAMWFINQNYTFTSEFLTKIDDINWKIQGVADFNNDGKMDIVWRNYGSGENALWEMNGAAIDKASFLPKVENRNLVIEQVTDLTGDGKPDIVWRNYSSGENTVWRMNGTSYEEMISLTKVDDLKWEISP